MTYSWMELAEQEKEKAVQRVKESEMLLGLALEAYKKHPDQDNNIAVRAATILLRESKAQLSEWDCE